jgi:glycosyltransferase involved in cell wall biosynthesis
VPDLFRATSVVVLPYDSATGSSGPAHQACEYGVPVVSADIPDFRDMASDENMAIRFYKTGDRADLAAQLIALLESPEEQRRAAAQNYSAAIRMTMPYVVRHYLRWFELEKRKRTFDFSTGARFLDRWRRRSFQPALHGLPPDALANLTLRGVSGEEKASPGNGTSAGKEPGPVRQRRLQG